MTTQEEKLPTKTQQEKLEDIKKNFVEPLDEPHSPPHLVSSPSTPVKAPPPVWVGHHVEKHSSPQRKSRIPKKLKFTS